MTPNGIERWNRYSLDGAQIIGGVGRWLSRLSYRPTGIVEDNPFLLVPEVPLLHPHDEDTSMD